MSHKSFIRNIFTQDGLHGEELEAAVNAFCRIDFKKHDMLLEEGSQSKEYYFIESGFIRSFAIDPHGNDVTTGFYTSGEILMEWPSFLLQKPTKENIQALSDCVCWKVGFDQFQELFHGIVAFREAGRSRLVGSYFNLKQRSIAMITDTAKERYLQLLSEHPEIIHQAALKHIASYLGITDTSLSRIRKEVAQE